MKNKRLALIILVIAVSLSACSSKQNTAAESLQRASYGMTNDAAAGIEYETKNYAAPSYNDYDSAVQGNGLSVMADASLGAAANVIADKIIMSGDVLLETDEFDLAVVNIRSLVAFYNGYTASSNLYSVNRGADVKKIYSAVIKIPAEQFSYAFDNIKSMAGLKNASQQQENVSEQYADAETRLATRKIEEERLLNLIDRTSDINELLNLERRLWEVRTDIELFQSRIKNIDRLVAYSTITINIREADKTTQAQSDSLAGRIKEGFASSLSFLLGITQGFTYIVAASVLPFIIIVLSTMIILWVIRKILRRN